jgi:hypothetical protein
MVRFLSSSGHSLIYRTGNPAVTLTPEEELLRAAEIRKSRAKYARDKKAKDRSRKKLANFQNAGKLYRMTNPKGAKK